MRALALVMLLAALGGVTGCKRRDDAAAPAPDAATAPRPRPAEVAHVTLKVLGMT